MREGREGEEEVEQLDREGQDGVSKGGREACNIFGGLESQDGRIGGTRRWSGGARDGRSIGDELIWEYEILEVVRRAPYSNG